MKKFISIFAVLFIALSLGVCSCFAEGNNDTKAFKVGPYTLKINPETSKFLFSNLIFPKQKKKLVIFYRKGSWAGDKMASEVYGQMLKQAYDDWSKAANEHLPSKYKMPEISVSVREIPANLPTDEAIVFLKVRDLAYDNKIATANPKYSKIGDGTGMVSVYIDGARYWYEAAENGNYSDQEAKRNYFDQIKAFLPNQQDEYLKNQPVETWDKKGPWYNYQQQAMTHELGHLFGLGHTGEKDSVMQTRLNANRNSAKPTEKDGWNLALINCLYHNQKAKKDVCVPYEIIAPIDDDKLKELVLDINNSLSSNSANGSKTFSYAK